MSYKHIISFILISKTLNMYIMVNIDSIGWIGYFSLIDFSDLIYKMSGLNKEFFYLWHLRKLSLLLLKNGFHNFKKYYSKHIQHNIYHIHHF